KLSASEISSRDSILDSRLFDIPQESKTAGAQGSVSDKALDDLQKLPEGVGISKVESEPVPERKLPWLIDIFLYPTNKAGLTSIGIIIVLPLLINIVAGLLGPFGFFISIPGFFFIKIPIVLYLFWYLAECVRDSALGGIQAPETLGNAPGLGDMFWHTLKIIGCCV
ncbi:unnamed protein product, partial [marine sediment metagenome]